MNPKDAPERALRPVVNESGIEIQPLRCDHWSQIRLKDGKVLSQQLGYPPGNAKAALSAWLNDAIR